MKGGDEVTDSTITRNGSFQFKGETGDDPSKAILSMKWPKAKAKPGEDKTEELENVLYLEQGTFTVKGKLLKDAVITGGKTQEEFNTLNNRLAPVQAALKPLYDSSDYYYDAKRENDLKRLRPIIQQHRLQLQQIEKDFCREFPDSYISLLTVKENGFIIELPEFEPQWNGLSERVRNTREGKKLAARLAIAKRTDVGQPAIDFTQNDTKGEPVSLASLKGKFVLIDFWASWCGPCREENPHVVKAYKKFHDKNFEIIAVSLDDKKEDWIKAIEKDGLTWLHVSDLKGWKNEVAEAYGIKAVPQNLLLDTKGKIIAKNLSGEELEAKLKAVIGE